MSEDKGPGEDGQEELYAVFAALGGPLSRDEFMQVPVIRSCGRWGPR